MTMLFTVAGDPVSSSSADTTTSLEAWEHTVRAAISVANVPTLLMVLTQLTGDLSWLEPPYRISRTKGMADNDTGGLPDDLQDRVRAAAAEAVVAWKRAGSPETPLPEPDLVARMLAWSMGDRVHLGYGEFLRAELRTGEGVRPAPEPLPGAAGKRIAIIGGGLSGIAAGIRMKALGFEVVLFEKHADIGGVWHENRYPGAGVDTPSHLYSYSFAPADWSKYFAGRDEISTYLHEVVAKFEVGDDVRLEHEVTRVVFDPRSHAWEVHVTDANGRARVERADFVLSCVGAFNPPLIPAISGLEDFEGPAFHSAQWPDGLSLEGKSVALIGNGATAMQLAPAIAPAVASFAIFQRSPQWVQPFEKFQQEVPGPVRLLFREVPLYRAWYRLRLQWIFHDKLYQSLRRDPAWSERRDAINEANAGHREYFTSYIAQQLGDRTDLLEKVVPDYPPFGKRMLLDNGWFRTLTLPHVDLITDKIDSIGSTSVRTSAGEEYAADVIVFATGFDVVRFVSTFDVIGRDGTSLREAWDDIDCRAFLGLAIPGFPNFFTLYGPNTQTGHGGSLIHTVESQLDYLESLLSEALRRGVDTLECRREVYDQYSETVDKMQQDLIWSHPAMTTYYRNERGRVVVINPFRNLDFWNMTRQAQLSDFETTLAAEV